MAISDTPSITSFVSGTTISSSEVNTNFSNLQSGFAPNVVAAQTIASGGTITLQSDSRRQFLKVLGDGAATLAAALFNTTPSASTIITLIGQDNTNTLELQYADTAGGVIMNGPTAVLGSNDIINFLYDSSADRYLELGRNF